MCSIDIVESLLNGEMVRETSEDLVSVPKNEAYLPGHGVSLPPADRTPGTLWWSRIRVLSLGRTIRASGTCVLASPFGLLALLACNGHPASCVISFCWTTRERVGRDFRPRQVVLSHLARCTWACPGVIYHLRCTHPWFVSIRGCMWRGQGAFAGCTLIPCPALFVPGVWSIIAGKGYDSSPLADATPKGHRSEPCESERGRRFVPWFDSLTESIERRSCGCPSVVVVDRRTLNAL